MSTDKLPTDNAAPEKDQEAQRFSRWIHGSYASLESWLQEQGYRSVQELLEAKKRNSNAA